MAGKRVEKKKIKKVSSKTDLMQQMAAKLEVLENQIQERDARLDMLDNTQKNLDKGSQRFGASDWKDWINGSEKGYFRSFYVDIKSMVTPRSL